MNPRAFIKLFGKVFAEWSRHKAPTLAAALAYYTVFSMSPLLLIIISIAGLVFGQQAAQSQILGQVQGVIGSQGGALLEQMLSNAYQPRTNIILTVVGLVTLLLGAIGVFGQLQDSLNTIWEVKPKENQGIKGLVWNRILSFGLLLGTGFLLLVSLVLSAALQAVSQYFGSFLPFSSAVLEAINFAFSFLVITLLFAMIFRIVPDTEIDWRDVWIGAAFTALLFVIGKYLLGLYLGRGSTTSAFGAAGSLVILLLWVYYSAQILFFGAEFTKVYAETYGSRGVPGRKSERSDVRGAIANKAAPQPDGEKGDTTLYEQPRAAEREWGVRGDQPAGDSNRNLGPENRAVKTRLGNLTFQRNVGVLFGFLAGAITGARILGNAGRNVGDHRHNGKR